MRATLNRARDLVPRSRMARKKAANRELINTGTDKRYVRRDAKGQFKESDDVGRSLANDRRRKAKTKAAKGRAIAGIAECSSSSPIAWDAPGPCS